MKLKDVLLVISIALIVLGVGSFIGAAILLVKDGGVLGDILLGLGSVFGISALAVLVFRLMKTSDYKPDTNNGPKIIVKVVDVKDLPKSKEEKLYNEYENLYKQGLITKEDLELKRKELLGK